MPRRPEPGTSGSREARDGASGSREARDGVSGSREARDGAGTQAVRAARRAVLLALAGSLALGSCRKAEVPEEKPVSRGEEELRALDEIERRAAPEDLPILERALESPHRAVRARAARALGRLPGEVRVGPLAALLEPGEYEHVRRDAAWALGRCGRAALEVLVRTSRDPSPGIRVAAIRGLLRTGADLSPWWKGWARDIDPTVRREAFHAADLAAGAFGPEEARCLLEEEKHPDVRWSIIEAVARSPRLVEALRPELARAALSPSFLEAVAAIEALGTHPASLPEDLCSIAEDRRLFWMQREAAIDGLGAQLALPDLEATRRQRIEAVLAAEAAAAPRLPGDIHVLRRARKALSSRAPVLPPPLEAPAPIAEQGPAGSALALAPGEALPYALPPIDPAAWGSPILRERRKSPAIRRPPRARLSIQGKGEIILDLYTADAPHHTGSFLRLAQEGRYTGRPLEPVDPRGSVGVSIGRAQGPLAGVLLPDETHLDFLVRGSVFSLPAPGTGRTAAGSFRIALRPLPRLEEKVTVWGRVALGFETLDSIVEGDLIASVTRHE